MKLGISVKTSAKSIFSQRLNMPSWLSCNILLCALRYSLYSLKLKSYKSPPLYLAKPFTFFIIPFSLSPQFTWYRFTRTIVKINLNYWTSIIPHRWRLFASHFWTLSMQMQVLVTLWYNSHSMRQRPIIARIAGKYSKYSKYSKWCARKLNRHHAHI